MPPTPATTDTNRASLTQRVERVHLVLVAVLVVTAVALAELPVWSGVLAGGLVGAANFRALAFLTQRFVGGETRTRNSAIGLLLLKFALLAGVLGAIVTWLAPNPIAFLVGLTLAPVCLVGIVLTSRRPAALPEAT